ncbi:MAG: hypothetical protein ACYCS7_09260, partial [Acidimicrobiales bacterium]
MIQPAGALSAQVPAVGVREQNVNSAGRIRVALPKTGTASGFGVRSGPWFNATNSTPVALADVQGKGVFTGVVMVVGTGAGNGSGFHCGQPGGWVTVTVDGHVAFQGDGCWGADGYYGASSALGGSNNGGSGELHFFPPRGMPFQKSLVVTVEGDSGTPAQLWGQAYYTTG